MITKKKTTHIVTNLATYYNRQLSYIKSMVIELVEINQHFIILMTKILLVLQHFVCKGFSISEDSYRSELELYASTE